MTPTTAVAGPCTTTARASPRRRWPWLVVAAVVVGLVLLVDGAVAGADEPHRDDSDHSCAGDAEANDGALLPDECWGRYPTSNYDIGFKDGNTWAISRKIFGGLTELAFHASRSVVQLALWLITWAYSWDIENVFGGVGSDLAVNFDNSVVDELMLYDKVWFAAIGWAGFVSLRGRLPNAAGELMLSFLLAILGATLLGDLDGYRNGALYTLRDLSLVPLVLIDDNTTLEDLQDDDLTDEELQDRLLDDALVQMHQGFVEQPHDVINWGQDLSQDGMEHCADLRDDILGHVGMDSHEDRDNGADERDYMKDNGCESLHKFNEDPTAERLFSAVLYVAAAAVLLVLLALTALTVVLTKMFVVGLFALAPLVAPFAVLPGAGRRLVWSWIAALARSGLAVAGVGFVLSLMLMTVDALLGATNDFPLYARFFLIDMLVVAAIVARKRVLAAGQNLTQQMADRAAARPIGSTAVPTWMGGPGGAALGPMGNVGPPLRLHGGGGRIGGDPAGALAATGSFHLRRKWGEHRMQVRYRRSRHRSMRREGQSTYPRLPKRVASRMTHPVRGWKAPPRTQTTAGGWRANPELTRRGARRPGHSRGGSQEGPGSRPTSQQPNQSAPPPSGPPPRNWPPANPPSAGGAPT